MATVTQTPTTATTTHAPIQPGPFRNEPLTDFSKPENASAMKAAIEKVRKELGREYPLVINGRPVTTTGKIKSINPAHPSEVVGVFQKADKGEVEPAMNAAVRAFESWSRVPIEERAQLLLRV